MKKRLLYNTIFSVLFQIFSVISGIILPRLYLVHYGSEVNGLVHSITQFLGIISFMELGIGQVIQSALYKPLADKDHNEISKICVSGSKYFRKIAALLAMYTVVLMFAYPYVSKQNFGLFYIATLVASLSINSLVQYCFGIVDRILLKADQRDYIQCAIQIAVLLCNVGLSILLITTGTSIQIVKLATSLVLMLSPIIVRVYIKRNYTLDRKITYKEEPIKQKWNGIAQHLSYVVLDGTDTIVLTLFSTLTNVSVYSVYHMIIYGMMQLYRAATAGFHAILGDMWAKQETDRLHRVFENIETLLHYAVVFLFSCAAVLIIPFVRIYTYGIPDANYIQPIFAVILLFAHAFQCLRSVYNMPILAAGHYKQTQSCHIVAAILNLTISIVTVKIWGIVGVAIGTLVALAYQTIWMVVYNSRNLLKQPLKHFVKHLIVDLMTSGVIVGVGLALCWDARGYVEWFTMALLVSSIALIIVGVSMVLFYKSQFHDLKGQLIRRKKK